MTLKFFEQWKNGKLNSFMTIVQTPSTEDDRWKGTNESCCEIFVSTLGFQRQQWTLSLNNSVGSSKPLYLETSEYEQNVGYSNPSLHIQTVRSVSQTWTRILFCKLRFDNGLSEQFEESF